MKQTQSVRRSVHWQKLSDLYQRLHADPDFHQAQVVTINSKTKTTARGKVLPMWKATKLRDELRVRDERQGNWHLQHNVVPL